MSKKTAILISHSHAAKWLQIVIHSLKTMYGSASIPFDIFVAETWPGHPSLKAITETSLGDHVCIHTCTGRLKSHDSGLDELLDLVRDDYDFVFATETDCRAIKLGWLDWFHSHIHDAVGMAGFFWHEGDHHFNINPSATLYRMSMLAQYHDEAKANKDMTFYHPNGNAKGTQEETGLEIKSQWGAFSETRGIKNPTNAQQSMIVRGVPHAGWYEPGQWLHYRAIGDWICKSVACDHIYQQISQFETPKGTFYGGEADPYFIHYWGGTRAWDHLKGTEPDHFVKTCSKNWIDREHQIWVNTVSEEYRTIMPSIYEELGLEGMGYND